MVLHENLQDMNQDLIRIDRRLVHHDQDARKKEDENELTMINLQTVTPVVFPYGRKTERRYPFCWYYSLFNRRFELTITKL
jgi:hypothetical protein